MPVASPTCAFPWTPPWQSFSSRTAKQQQRHRRVSAGLQHLQQQGLLLLPLRAALPAQAPLTLMLWAHGCWCMHPMPAIPLYRSQDTIK
jgi:hypothetical protein